MEQIFTHLAIILFTAFIVSYIAKSFKQPIIIGYILAGVIISPFILAFGVSLLVSALINLKFFKYKTKYEKIAVIFSVYFLSVITGNLSEHIFHLGEYGAALVTAFFGPIIFSFVLHKSMENKENALSIIAGGIFGFGVGLFFANYTGLSIIGQGWFGIICGTSIALGLGISFGLMLAPRIGELMTNVFRFKPTIGLLVSIGFVIGTMAGVIAIGFMNR